MDPTEKPVANWGRAEKLRLARYMKENPTPSERVARDHFLDMHRYFGWPLPETQVLLLGYIPDFCFPAAKVVVEIDGGSHNGREKEDARRDSVFKRHGYKVLHIRADSVLTNVLKALKSVGAHVGRESPRRSEAYALVCEQRAQAKKVQECWQSLSQKRDKKKYKKDRWANPKVREEANPIWGYWKRSNRPKSLLPHASGRCDTEKYCRQCGTLYTTRLTADFCSSDCTLDYYDKKPAKKPKGTPPF